MRNLLAVFSVAVLTFAAVGWYLGWYRVENTPAQTGHRAVSIDIDKDKIEEDLYTGEEKLQELLDKKHKDGANKAEEKAKIDKSAPTSKR